jgi:hypothetical protein
MSDAAVMEDVIQPNDAAIPGAKVRCGVIRREGRDGVDVFVLRIERSG